MALRPSSETAPSFLMFAMNTERFYRSVVSGLGATTSPHVNVGDIRVKLLPRPHRDEQDLIAVAFTNMQHQMHTDGFVLIKLHSSRSGIIPDLLTSCV